MLMASQLLMAKSPEEAISAKTAQAAFLAGGTEVNRLGSSVDAETLISLKKCSGLDGIESDAGYVTIGSMCTFQQLIESDKVPAYIREAAHFMASRTKRNMATIGGNIASMRSDSYMIPALIAAGAVLELAGSGGSCRIGIEEYLDKAAEYAGCLILSVTVPEKIKLMSKRYSNTAQSHAVLTMSAAVCEDGIVMAAALKNSGIYRLMDFEKALKADPEMSDDDIISWFRNWDAIKVEADMFGGEDYKRYLMGVTACDFRAGLASGSGKEVES